MTTPGQPVNPGELDRFLDGLMSAEETAAFESRLSDAARREVELQHRIDSSLNRLFAYDASAKEAPPPQPLAFRSPRQSAPRRYGMLALAASLLLAVMWVYWPRREFKFVPAEAIYADAEKRNWDPAFVCKSDQEFVAKVRERLGQGLLIPSNLASIRLDGWFYADDYVGSPISDETMTLMATVEKDHVMVFMDRSGNDRSITLPKDSALKVFRRKVGSLVLYELTPRKEPALLDHATTQ
ncbi:MAG: hypothetical protein JSR77_12210 [Planctomycetes bacterium]|nr:hypothetical protein [Planctomycetota bacterium]